MKILAIGDFHGKFPNKLKDKIKKENVDLIVSIGDYFPFLPKHRKLFFKYAYKTNKDIWEFIGKKKCKEFMIKELKIGRKLIKGLDKLPVKIIGISGNIDSGKWGDAFRGRKDRKIWRWAEQDFLTLFIRKLKKMKFFDFSYIKFGEFIFIGYPASNFPGHVQTPTYRFYRKKLDRLFQKFKKENKDKRVIFVSHNVPYNTKLDKITSKEAHEKVKGKHYGSKLTRRIIDRYKPFLVLGGHMHENQGKCKVGKTIAINPGAAIDGKAAIINLPENKKEKIKVRFIK